MSDQEKTDKAVPLVDLDKTDPVLLPEVKFTEEETLATAGVFKRFALWLMGQKNH